MSQPICRHVRRTLSLSTLLLLPAAGFSQEASESGTASSQQVTETIVVSGIRASFDNAIKAKRNADAIVDAISAEDVGKFPDQNVAESLSHLPGLSVDRQFGEGEKVSILGTDPALNRVLINGQTVASADWGGNPNDPTSRTFNYLLLSPDLIGLAEVYKSQESRLDEGSIGGTVIIHTRKPLDLEPNTIRVSGGYEYNDRSEGGNMRGSLLYSWKDADANFGILGAYSHDKETLARAGLEVFGYSDASGLAAKAPNATITGNLAGALYPAGINADYFQQTRQRDSFTTTLQANPTDSLKFDLTGIYIQGKYDNISQAMFIYPAASPGDLLSATVNNGLVTSASYGPGAYSERDADFRKTTVKTDSITLTTNWDSGGPISLQNVIGSTKASGGKDPEYLLALYGNSPYSYSYTGTSATVNFAQSPADPTTFGRAQGQQIGGIGYYVQGDTEKYAQLDLTWKIDAGPLSKLLVGVKYTDHENYEVVDTSKVFVQNAYTSEAAFDPGRTPSNLFNGIGINGNIAQFATVSQGAMINYDLSTPDGTTFAESKTSEFDIKEKTTAAYVESLFAGQLAGKDYHGNVGVRFVHTTDTSFGWLFDSATSQAGAPYTTINPYTKVLPSANFTWSVLDDVLLRLGVAKVIARPRFEDLAPAFSTDDTGLTANGGNPKLKPYESVNYDASAEWYFDQGSLLSLELFYRDISQYVITKEHDETLYNPLKGTTLTYFVTNPINYAGANVKGAAVQFEKPIAAGFGIATNYTWAEAQTTNGYNMPYLSRSTWNLIPYYERGPFSARVSYGYRSPYFTAIGRLRVSQFTGAYRELDASATWKITDNFQLTVAGSNLLDELYNSYNGVQAAPVGLYKNGRLFTANFTYKH